MVNANTFSCYCVFYFLQIKNEVLVIEIKETLMMYLTDHITEYVNSVQYLLNKHGDPLIFCTHFINISMDSDT